MEFERIDVFSGKIEDEIRKRDHEIAKLKQELEEIENAFSNYKHKMSEVENWLDEVITPTPQNGKPVNPNSITSPSPPPPTSRVSEVRETNR